MRVQLVASSRYSNLGNDRSSIRFKTGFPEDEVILESRCNERSKQVIRVINQNIY